MSGLTWVIVDAADWRQVSSATFATREAAEDHIPSGLERGWVSETRPDLAVPGLTLLAVPEELVRRAAAAADRDEAVRRTFELSEALSEARAAVVPLRELLGRVMAECVPSLVDESPDRLHGIWRDIQQARRRS